MRRGKRRLYNPSMRVRVLFFGKLKEIVGREHDDAEISDGTRVSDLDRKSTRLNSSHRSLSRMPSSA